MRRIASQARLPVGKYSRLRTFRYSAKTGRVLCRVHQTYRCPYGASHSSRSVFYLYGFPDFSFDSVIESGRRIRRNRASCRIARCAVGATDGPAVRGGIRWTAPFDTASPIAAVFDHYQPRPAVHRRVATSATHLTSEYSTVPENSTSTIDEKRSTAVTWREPDASMRVARPRLAHPVPTGMRTSRNTPNAWAALLES